MNKVALIVTDGLGYSCTRQQAILNEVWSGLAPATSKRIADVAESVLAKTPVAGLTPGQLALAAMYPVAVEALRPDTEAEVARRQLACLEIIRNLLKKESIWKEVALTIGAVAGKRNYVPWETDWEAEADFRNGHLTVPTHAGGGWVGLEDVSPPVQGNSETGHIQIGSLEMVPQISRRITDSILNGSFSSNPQLMECVEWVLKKGCNLNFCFMLSGTCGNDGLVHSNWKHFEAFADMVFGKYSVPPERVRMLAILDGRDSALRSSVEADEQGIGNYLEQARQVLLKHDAVNSLAWVIGRNIVMDRDYQEHNMEQTWQLLVSGGGKAVPGFDSAVEEVRAWHRNQSGDSSMPPVAIADGGGNVRTIQQGDVFVNLNFRSDRQRALTATLLADKQFLLKESQLRRRQWNLAWLNRSLDLKYCCLSNYSPEFDNNPAASVAYPKTVAPNTLLSLLGETDAARHKYALVAESVKSSHMGYFIRGCREFPVHRELEERHIVPSLDTDAGVRSDSDVYLHPAMRTGEIEQLVTEKLKDSSLSLLICNFAATDMVGHLLPLRREAAVKAYQSTVDSVLRVAEAAIAGGWHVIWTSDHGNIEEDTPSHTANNVLTTIATPSKQRLPLSPAADYQARLFDVSATVARLLNLKVGNLSQSEVFRGRPLV